MARSAPRQKHVLFKRQETGESKLTTSAEACRDAVDALPALELAVDRALALLDPRANFEGVVENDLGSVPTSSDDFRYGERVPVDHDAFSIADGRPKEVGLGSPSSSCTFSQGRSLSPFQRLTGEIGAGAEIGGRTRGECWRMSRRMA